MPVDTFTVTVLDAALAQAATRAAVAVAAEICLAAVPSRAVTVRPAVVAGDQAALGVLASACAVGERGVAPMTAARAVGVAAEARLAAIAAVSVAVRPAGDAGSWTGALPRQACTLTAREQGALKPQRTQLRGGIAQSDALAAERGLSAFEALWTGIGVTGDAERGVDIDQPQVWLRWPGRRVARGEERADVDESHEGNRAGSEVPVTDSG